MIRYDVYTDKMYDGVVQLLKDAEMYDEAWETRDNLQRKIERDPKSIIVAVDSKHIVGCVFLVEDGWNAFIWRLCVAEAYRKQGIGKTLVEKVEKIVKKRGLKEVSLFVDVNNERLKEWYLSQDYITASNWTFMYKQLDNQFPDN